MIILIEATVISYLMTALETENVYAERPTAGNGTLPEEYYIVERTGGGERNHIQNAMIAVQSVSSVSLLRAARMNRAAVRAMRSITETEDVSSCRLNADYNFTDTESKQYRYQAVFDMTFMEGEET